ncbi:MAG TPA: Ig-like domain-containing protein, partial [Gaiellaceae bacterium]
MISTRSWKWAAMALVWLVAAAVVTLAIVRQNGRGEPSHSRATSSLLSSATAGSPGVELVGAPGTVDRPTTLKAAAKARSGRIVAVTFLMDGEPLGSDTVAPYTLLLDPGRVRPGSHRLRAAAVDSLGRRRSTEAVGLRTKRVRTKALTATPEKRLDRALAALRRGDVTVRLAPGRYQLHDLKIGDGARLLGSGPETVITPPSGASYFAVLVAKGRNIAISDLTV